MIQRSSVLAIRLAWHQVLTVGALLAGASGLSAAEVNRDVQWFTNYYTVTGATTREIRMSINRSRPWKEKLNYDGYTDWKVNWRFRTVREEDGCRITEFRPSAVITTTLPRWVPPPDVAPEVKAAWRQYILALIQHETVHGRFAYATVADMKKKVPELPVLPCDQLPQRINQESNAIMDEYRRREKEFDQRTNHGATQGIRLR